MPVAAPKSSTMSLVRRVFLSYLKPYLGPLILAFFFMVLAAGMTASIAMLMQPILDDVLYGREEGIIVFVSCAVFATFFVRGFATYVHTVIMAKTGQSVIADIQRDLFGRFMTLDLAFFHANPSGQLLSRVINDVNVMRLAVSDTLTGIGKSSVTLVFLVGVMFYQDWKLALASFVIAPFVVGFVVYLGRRLRTISASIQHELAGLSALLSQIFQGIRQVQAYGMEDYERERAGRAVESVKRLNIKAVRIGNLSTPVNEFLIGAVAAFIIGYGGYQAVAGVITAGQLVSFLTAFTMAYEPMKKLARLNNSLQTGLGAAERVFDMVDRTPAIQDKPDAVALSVAQPEITFKGVEFQYEENDLKALNTIDFTARPGKVTALVGPSGGGKSSLINLIPRFYDVLAGEILIDGHDVRDLTLETLRANIALVSQDITIFDDTIGANIAYGKPDATQEEIEIAARAAAADAFITAFPGGYNTKTGEDGVKLSGGQRQRIAIARAILRDAPILLLDEATSALDNESEQAIQEALVELEKGRTTLVIAHRLSTVQSADQIVVLDKGRIVEKGTHAALIEKGGLYAQMHRAGLRE